MLDTYRELVTSSVDLYVSAISNRLNLVVNRLTMATVVIGCLAVITGFYGMNFERTWPPFAAGLGGAVHHRADGRGGGAGGRHLPQRALEVRSRLDWNRHAVDGAGRR